MVRARPRPQVAGRRPRRSAGRRPQTPRQPPLRHPLEPLSLVRRWERRAPLRHSDLPLARTRRRPCLGSSRPQVAPRRWSRSPPPHSSREPLPLALRPPPVPRPPCSGHRSHKHLDRCSHLEMQTHPHLARPRQQPHPPQIPLVSRGARRLLSTRAGRPRPRPRCPLMASSPHHSRPLRLGLRRPLR